MLLSTLAAITNPVLPPDLGTGTGGGTGVASIIATIIRLLVVVGAIIMILYLLIGGINWITAEGKPEKLEKSRNQITQAITGMIILAATIAIASLIGAVLGFNLLDIEIPALSST